MTTSLVCYGAVTTGILQTNGRKLVVGAVNPQSIESLNNPVGGAVTPTVSGTAITFGTAQTLPADFAIVFASQPGVIYNITAAINDSVSGNLVQTYTGPAGATTAEGVEAAAWTEGPNEFTCSDSQTLPVGFEFQVDGTGQVYTLTAPVAGVAVIPQTSFTPAFAGGAGAYTLTAIASAATPVLCIESTSSTSEGSPVAAFEVVQVNGQSVTIFAAPYGVFQSTPGAQFLVAPGGTFECLGQNRQPVTFVTIPAGSLVV